MANPKNRATVEEALRTELERDRTKTYVVEISPLGLVEMTRQNVTDGPREILTKKCPTCAGDGIVISEASAAVDVERRLRTLAAGSRAQAFQVEVNPKTASILVGPGAARLIEIEAATKKRFFLVPKEGVHLDHAAVLAEGKLEALRPEAPVEEGKQVEVKLVELGLHDGERRGREARRPRRRRRRCREARRQEGEGADRARAGRCRLRLAGRGAPRAARSRSPSRARPRSRRVRRAGRRRPRPTRPRRRRSRSTSRPRPTRRRGRGSGRGGGRRSRSSTRSRRTSSRMSPRRTPRTARQPTTVKKKTRRGSRGGRNRKRKPAGEQVDVEAERGVEARGGRGRRAERRRRGRRPIRSARRRHGSTCPTSSLVTGSPRSGSRRKRPLRSPSPPPRPRRRPSSRTRSQTNRPTAPGARQEEDSSRLSRRTRPQEGSDTIGRRSCTASVALGANGAEPAAEEAERARRVSGRRRCAPRTVEPKSDDYVPMSEWLDDLDA